MPVWVESMCSHASSSRRRWPLHRMPGGSFIWIKLRWTPKGPLGRSDSRLKNRCSVTPRIFYLLVRKGTCSSMVAVFVHMGRCNKFRNTGGLTWQTCSLHSAGGWKSKVKVSAGVTSSEASLPGLQRAASSPCSHRVFPLCITILVSTCKSKFPLIIRTPVRLDLVAS